MTECKSFVKLDHQHCKQEFIRLKATIPMWGTWQKEHKVNSWLVFFLIWISLDNRTSSLPFEPQQDAVGSQHLPGVFEGFVVTGEPLLGSDHTAVDVVSHEVFRMFGSLPLNKHRRLGVSGGNNLTGSRWDACSRKNKSLLNSSNYIISGLSFSLSFWLLNLKIWFPLFPFPCHWDRSCCIELQPSLVFCRLSDLKLLNFMCHLSRRMLFKLCSIFCFRILHLPRFH